MIQAIIFDLDGTIIDSEMVAMNAIQQCMQDWGLEVSLEDASFVAGKKWEVAFDLLYSKYAMPVDKKIASELIVKKYQEVLRNDLRHVPGVVDAIHSFAEKLPLAVVSGSGREDVLWALEKLKVKDRFRFVLGAEDYPNSKPSPEGFLKALKILNVEPARSLVFEDSAAGISAGRAAGMKVVAITSTNHFGHDQSEAHHLIPDFVGIDASWLDRL